ncbi:hypothetical protein [Prosthecobacter sp.]|uniref:hypothetical protein n=1 Tax=Prosthecobacter sp. TaxID=1965333 RepID=UPI003784087C
MNASACPTCHAEIPAGAPACQHCGAGAAGGAPDYTKVGMGALGSVHVEHKPVGVLHQETHYHQHPAAVSVPRWMWMIGLVVVSGAIVLVVLNRAAPVIHIHSETAAAPGAPDKQVAPQGSLPARPAVVAEAQQPAVVEFDRQDRIYYGGEVQSLRITAPETGFLYVASHWADGRMRLLAHPAFKGSTQPVQKGQMISIPAVRLVFTPATADASESLEEICVLIGRDGQLDIPGSDTADVSQSWKDMTAGSGSTARQVVVSNASYRIRAGKRPPL